MNNYLLLVVIPNLNRILGMMSITGVLASVISICIYVSLVTNEGNKEICDKFLKNACKVILVTITCLLTTVFIPSKKEMIELKLLSIVSELKDVDQIPQKVIDRINDFLDGEEKDE